jgi:hypothetical protein
MNREIERCRREIAAFEAELLAGNHDVAGLCLALSDWSAELRILQGGTGKAPRIEGTDDQSSQADRAIGAGPHPGTSG